MTDFGENRVQEALAKFSDGEKGGKISGRFHLIGPLQTNKAKKAVQFFDVIQSLDRLELARELDRHARDAGKVMECLVEVKISDEPSKAGLAPETLPEFLEAVRQFPNVAIKGLMGIPPAAATGEKARPYFARLRALFEKTELEILSLGMSSDFETAIEEGSTMVRLGTALFGAEAMKHIVFIGGGNMGEALVAGLLASKQWKPSEITVTDKRPETLAQLKKKYKIQVSGDNKQAVAKATVILLAVKPQHMRAVLAEIGPVLRPRQLVLSIAAGIPCGLIEQFLAPNACPSFA